jgi:hypothetical protein
MAKVFSVASWNVEHFEGEESRVQRVVDFLDQQNPDVFGLFSHDATWTNGTHSSIPPSNLDHVFASTNLNFKSFPRFDGGTAQVSVRGWVNQPTDTKKDEWIGKFSDHSLLFCEVHT